MFFMSLYFGLGCTKSVAVQPKPIVVRTPIEQAARILDSSAFSDRVLLKQAGTIRLSFAGPSYSVEEPKEKTIPEERIAISSPDGIQVLMTIGCDSLVFFAYVAEEDLVRTTTRQAEVQRASDQGFQKSSFVLAPGAAIDIESCHESSCSFILHGKGYRLHPQDDPLDTAIKAWGLVDESVLGYVYQPQDFSWEQLLECYRIESGAALYDGAGGLSFLEFSEERIWYVTSFQEDVLQLQQNRMKVEGSIKPEKIQPMDCPIFIGKGHGCGWGVSHGKRISIPRGTPLFDQPNGRVVGVVAKEDRFLLKEEKEDWRKISVPNQWDGLGFWVQRQEE